MPASSNRRVAQIRPQYAEAFRCIGAECEDTCGSGWSVSIDKNTFEKYQAIPDSPLYPILQERLVRIETHASDLQYAKIKTAMKRVRSGARTGFARFKKNTEQNTSRSPARTILARSKPSITKQRKRCSSPVRKRQGWFCFTHNLFPMKQRLRRIPVCLCLLRRSRCRGRLPWYISGPSGNLLYCC